MNPQAAQSYLRTKVLTATPEQLQLMLFDGAIRFCDQARAALQQKNFELSHTRITQAQKIINELKFSLKHDVAPDLCSKLAALYTFAYRKLFDANTTHETKSLDEAVEVLKYQRQTWVMLMDDLGKKRATEAARSIDMPAPDPMMEARISMQG